MLKLIHRFSLFLIGFFVFQLSFSQENIGRAPLSFMDSSIFNNVQQKIIPIYLPELNNNKEKERADSISNYNCSDCKNKYYGRGINISIDIKSSGSQINLGDTAKLWLLQIESSTAYGMQFYFDKFKLPEGARLYIFNNDRTLSLGGYTSNNNPRDPSKKIKFGTEYISGNSIYLEYYELNNVPFQGELSIINVIHSFMKSGPFIMHESQYCQINTACLDGSGWEKEISSVAIVLGYNSSNQLQGFCSGTLLNNTNVDGTPYFLTARHCIDYNPFQLYDPGTWHFLFNHQTLTCNSDGSEISSYSGQSIYGALIRSSDGVGSPTTDFLLLELNTSEAILESYGACYAGWTIDPPQGPPFKGIHHPSGDVKKISTSLNPIYPTNRSSTTTNINGDYWKVKWSNDPNESESGVTEGGSSGSALFDKNHRVIGNLFGGFSHCAGFWVDGIYFGPDQPDWYGRFSKSWDYGGFDFWLDPYNVNYMAVNSYCPGIIGPGDGGIGGGGVNPCYTHLSQDGFYINNKLDLVTEVCPYYINIKAIPPNPASCSKGYFLLNNSQELFISVTLCNTNLVPVDVEYYDWVDVGSNNNFNLATHLPSPYIGLVSGQTYRVKIASNRWGWQEYTKYIHIASDNRYINGSNIVSDVYGQNIVIENSTVTEQKEIVASQSIKILPNSKLYAGNYRIDVNLDCNDFMGVGQNNEESVSRIINTTTGAKSKNKALPESIQSNTNFSLYPNPNNGVFTLVIENRFSNSLIEIYDVMGKKVISKRLLQVKSEINLVDYPKGIYFVKIMSGDNIFTEKIIYQ